MCSVLLIFGVLMLHVFDYVETTTAFNCRNSLISDEWRQMVLDEVNERRRILARGQQVDKTGKLLPKAKNMNRLNWDCNLEEIAFKGTLGNCSDYNDNNKRSPYLASQANFQAKDCDIHKQTKVLLYAWWKQAELIIELNDTLITGRAGADFIKMATAVTTSMGCTYDFCGAKGTIVCLFNDRNSINGRQLYEKASNDTEICDACAKTCEKYLCAQKSTPVTITPTCQHDKLTKDTNNAALWMHNYYRRQLASGWAKDPKAQSTYAPTAKAMRELEYDCAAAGGGASLTYDAIKDCPSADPKASPGYSMNFMRLRNYTISEQDALEHAVKTWWGQLETIGLGSDTTFDANAGITNFANMANDQAEKVACAVQNCIRQGETLVMCQYSPQIYEGDNIYVTGKECSGCKNLNKKCSNPRGLCVS